MNDSGRWKKRWERVAAHPRARALRARYAGPIAFAQRRLSPASDFGLHLTLGMMVMAAACFAFVELAEDIVEGEEITVVDHQVAEYVHARTTPALTRVVNVMTDAGSGPFLTVVGTGVAIYLVRRKEWHRLLTLMLVLPGGALLNVAIKHVFRRPRPEFENPIATLETFSFPSAHAMAATHAYGFLALLIVASAARWSAKFISVLAAAGVVVVVALSRIYLGVHFLSDVLGGIIVGLAWLSFGWTAGEALRQRSRRRASIRAAPANSAVR